MPLLIDAHYSLIFSCRLSKSNMLIPFWSHRFQILRKVELVLCAPLCARPLAGVAAKSVWQCQTFQDGLGNAHQQFWSSNSYVAAIKPNSIARAQLAISYQLFSKPYSSTTLLSNLVLILMRLAISERSHILPIHNY